MIPLALQHVVAAVVGIITPAIIVSSACGLSAEEETLLIQVALVMAGICTILQAFPIFGRIGSGLPVIMGSSFAYVPTLVSIDGTYGIATILGAEIIGGCAAIVFGIFLKPIRKLFPPVVTGTVIFTIGLSLYSVAVGYMAGDGSAATNPAFGSAQNWLIAIITLALVVFFSNFCKGVLKLGSLLWGMICSYIIAVFMGMVDFTDVATASWFSLPLFMPFGGFDFAPAACASLAIVYVVNCVQAIGDLSGATMGGMDREPTDEELRGGIISLGFMSILGSFFGGMPTSTYGQNVGIVTVNRVINRMVFVLAAAILLCAGLIPKFSAVLSTIPKSVIGGATIVVFATITMTGMRILIQGGLTPRKISVAGLSVALGIGVVSVSGSLAGAGFPSWVPTIFGSSSIVITAIVAILLNLILPKEELNELTVSNTVATNLTPSDADEELIAAAVESGVLESEYEIAEKAAKAHECVPQGSDTISDPTKNPGK